MYHQLYIPCHGYIAVLARFFFLCVQIGEFPKKKLECNNLKMRVNLFEFECSSIKSGNGKYPMAVEVSGGHVDGTPNSNNLMAVVVAFVLGSFWRLWQLN